LEDEELIRAHEEVLVMDDPQSGRHTDREPSRSAAVVEDAAADVRERSVYTSGMRKGVSNPAAPRSPTCGD
jgi:hypothetical protein